MPKHGKKFRDAQARVPEDSAFQPTEAVGLVKELSFAKFDETVEVAVRLGVDPRHADQIVRGAVVLPHGTGKTARVLVIAQGDKAREAEEAGADFVGTEYVPEDQGRVAGLRRRGRHARHDGPGGPAGPHPGPARPHAHAQGRDGDDGRRQGRPRDQGRQDRVPRGPDGERARSRSARSRSSPQSSRRTSTRSWTPSSAPSRRPPRARTCGR